MPREQSDVWRDIGLEKAKRGEGDGSYSRGVCIYCDKSMPRGSEKVIGGYDIHHNCYNPVADLRDRLMMLLNELERMTT